MPKKKIRIESIVISSFITELKTELPNRMGGVVANINTRHENVGCQLGSCPFACPRITGLC